MRASSFIILRRSSGLYHEEELPLRQLLPLRACTEDGLEGIRMKAGIPCFGRYGHGGRGEVLHLLQVKIEPFGKYCPALPYLPLYSPDGWR